MDAKKAQNTQALTNLDVTVVVNDKPSVLVRKVTFRVAACHDYRIKINMPDVGCRALARAVLILFALWPLLAQDGYQQASQTRPFHCLSAFSTKHRRICGREI